MHICIYNIKPGQIYWFWLTISSINIMILLQSYCLQGLRFWILYYVGAYPLFLVEVCLVLLPKFGLRGIHCFQSLFCVFLYLGVSVFFVFQADFICLLFSISTQYQGPTIAFYMISQSPYKPIIFSNLL